MLADEGARTRLGCDSCEGLAAPSGVAFRHGEDPRTLSRPTAEARGAAACKAHFPNSYFNDTRQLESSIKKETGRRSKAKFE